jgi:NAD+ diphosphatase
MTDRYVPLNDPPATHDTPALWFAFQRSKILVSNDGGVAAVPLCDRLDAHGVPPVRKMYLGTYDGRHCYAAEIAGEAALPEGWSAVGLRDFYGLVDEDISTVSGRAWQLLEWERNHRYCSRCGTEMQQKKDERARACPACRFRVYPPVAPAVMVLIKKGRELLLARKVGNPVIRYSALAGFVEPGETLEQTIRRETMEEVGVEVTNIRYFGSQPWPFPHSLMIAFVADYAGGEIRPDGVEIEEARWFDAAELPNRPPSISISRRLIDTTAGELV